MTTLVGLDLDGRRVVVVGGGPVAARRVHELRIGGAKITVVAPEVCEELAELADAAQITWEPAEVTERALVGAWFVHTATGSRAVDARVAGWAQAQRIFCVTASGVEAGSARIPATTRSGDLVVGVVGLGAGDPRRSVSVRDELAGYLRSGSVDLRRKRGGAGRVTLVGGGPGDVDLLTLRGRRAIAEADVVVTDRLGPVQVLEELRVGVEVIDVGKAPGHHATPQAEINALLVERARRGQVVVRLKGGDPFVFGRGGEEVLACRAAGVRVEVVPGVSSVVAAPGAAGIPLTHRGTTTSFMVVNGHDPLSVAARTLVRDRAGTLVVVMGVATLPRLVRDLLDAGADPALPVAVVENGGAPAQRVTHSRLEAIAERAAAAGVRAPAVIVIGEVAAPDLLDPVPRSVAVDGSAA